jgi:8-oxo-dGTP pyrophosphatase MutT (NUDIX family)
VSRTWDGQPIADSPPTGAAIVVYRRLGDRVELLLLHRAHIGPDFADDWAWGPPSGCRFPGEDIDRCAARELAEETGLALPVRRIDAESGPWVYYLAEAPLEAEIALSAEHDRYAWLPIDRAVDAASPEVVRSQVRRAAAAIDPTPD